MSGSEPIWKGNMKSNVTTYFPQYRSQYNWLCFLIIDVQSCWAAPWLLRVLPGGKTGRRKIAQGCTHCQKEHLKTQRTAKQMLENKLFCFWNASFGTNMSCEFWRIEISEKNCTITVFKNLCLKFCHLFLYFSIEDVDECL